MTVDYLAYITTNCHRHHCRQLSNSSVNHTSHLAKQQAVRPAVRPPQYAPPPASGYLNNHTEWVGDLDLWPFDLRIGGNISRGTDNLPANFGYCDFLLSIYWKHASDLRRDLITLTFDFWLLTSPRMSVKWVIVLHPCTKSEVRRFPLRKIWRIFCLSINRPRYLDLWPFIIIL